MMRSPATFHHRSGVTLIEMIFVVAIGALLVTLVAPSFREMILTQRLRSVTAQFVTDMQYARSEALARGRVVSVRARTVPPNRGGGWCYTLFLAPSADLAGSTGKTRAESGNALCDCSFNPTTCGTTGSQELRTVRVDQSSGVAGAFSLPYFGFHPVTGALAPQTVSEAGLPTVSEFELQATVSTARRLTVRVAMSGTSSICRPSGSRMSEATC